MEETGRFPYRFFVVTFAWSWLIWLPLVLAGAGIIPLGKDLLGALTVPWIAVGVFGPGVGALYSLRTLRGKGAVREYLRGLLDLRFGWWGWLAPPLVLGVTTWLAWILPELWGAPRLKMLLPAVWTFAPYLLLMIFLGGGQEELGWRGYILDPLEERLGPWLGNLVLGVVWAVWHVPLIFIPGTSQRFAPFLGFTLVLIGYSYFYAAMREAAGKRTMVGSRRPRLGERVRSAVPYDRDGRRGSTAALLDLGGPHAAGWRGRYDRPVEMGTNQTRRPESMMGAGTSKAYAVEQALRPDCGASEVV